MNNCREEKKPPRGEVAGTHLTDDFSENKCKRHRQNKFLAHRYARSNDGDKITQPERNGMSES